MKPLHKGGTLSKLPWYLTPGLIEQAVQLEAHLDEKNILSNHNHIHGTHSSEGKGDIHKSEGDEGALPVSMARVAELHNRA